jgi:hypothetical protein
MRTSEQQEASVEADRGRGTFIERNDWKVWAGISLIVVLFGVGDIQIGGATFEVGETVMFEGVTGMTWGELMAADPAAARFIDGQVRGGGAQLLLIGLLTLAITMFGLRRGQRWAWLTMWLWPAWLALVLIMLLLTEKVPGAGVPVPMISGTIFLVITVATLILSYRKYNATR